MNQLTITVNPYKAGHTVMLNGKSVSIYSEFSNFVKEPLLNWAHCFYETAEREINDEFHLTVVGDAFAQRFFRDLLSAHCRSFTAKDFTLNDSTLTRIQTAQLLAEKRSVDLTSCQFGCPLFTKEDVGEVALPFVMVPPEEAFLLLAGSEKDIPYNRDASIHKLAIIPNDYDDNRLYYREDGVYIWHMDTSCLSEALQEILDSFCFSLWVAAAAEKLSENCTEEQDLRLQALTAVSPMLTVGTIEDIPLGSHAQISYLCFPLDAKIPKIKAVPVTDGILQVDDSTLIGIGVGCTDVEFFADDDPMPFARRSVRVFHENLVQSIATDITALQLSVGQTKKLQFHCVPETAVDIQQVQFASSNENILSIEDGTVTALAPGEARVTITTAKAQAEIVVLVVPAIQALRLSQKEIPFFVGDTCPIFVSAEPKEAVMPDCEWVSGNSRITIVETGEDGQMRVRAIGVGDTSVICRSKDGTLQSECRVSVESTFNKPNNRNTGVSVALRYLRSFVQRLDI